MRRLHLLPFILYFFSGATALVYQNLWLRLLSLIFGVTVYSAVTVLASFMTGLALGSYISGKLADRVKNHFLWFGIIELVIGCTAFISPYVLELSKSVYVATYRIVSADFFMLTAVRFLVSFLVLIIPTTLMGATFPMLAKSAFIHDQKIEHRISLLYGINTVGAVLGTLLTGFYLIGNIGIAASFSLAALVNLIVGGIAVTASVKAGASGNSKDVQEIREQGYPNSIRSIILVGFFFSGLASLALEVIWFRILVFYIPATAYAFSVMLATVLLGIGLGSVAESGFFKESKNKLQLFIIIQMLISLAVLASIIFLRTSFDFVNLLQNFLGSKVYAESLLMVISSFTAMFPAAFLLGVAFPLGLSLWINEHRIGESIGIFYSLNTIGCIFGPLLAGFILLPRFGMVLSLITISLTWMGIAVVLWFRIKRTRNVPARLPVLLMLVYFVMIILLPDPYKLAVQYFLPTETVRWQRDGVQATVTVNQRHDNSYVMYLDGHFETNDSPKMVGYHKEIGQLALSLHPGSRKALVVGLGGGLTANTLAKYPGIQVDVVELSEVMIEASKWFSHVNDHVTEQKNVNMIISDGRNYLLMTQNKYDIIAADTMQIQHAGSGNLYSKEYFMLVRNALNPDGIFVQWVGSNWETESKLVMRTFIEVFPKATLWLNGTLLVGSKTDLNTANITPDIMDNFTAGPEEILSYAGEGPILTDDRPMVEYSMFALPREKKMMDISGMLNK